MGRVAAETQVVTRPGVAQADAELAPGAETFIKHKQNGGQEPRHSSNLKTEPKGRKTKSAPGDETFLKNEAKGAEQFTAKPRRTRRI